MEHTNEQHAHNVNLAESKVLGIVLNKPSYMYEIQKNLSEEMFSVESHKLIYSRMSSLFDETYLPNFDIIKASLSSAGVLESVGGEDFLRYLKGLITEEEDYKNIKNYVNIVVKAFKSREVLKIGKYVRQLEENIDIVDVVVEDIKNKIDYIDTKGFKSDADRIAAFLPDAWRNYKERMENPGLIGVTSGYNTIDSFTGGLREGNLWIIGGRPSHGKTAFALNSTLRTAQDGTGVLFFSLEMNSQQIIDRLVSLISKVEHTKIMLGTTSAEEADLVQAAYKYLKKLPIYLSTIYSLDASEIVRTRKEQVRQHDIKTVWIDYVQLSAERDGDAVHTIGRISRACKLLSKELEIFIGLISQLNRNVEMRDDKRPVKADLRQSGNLEEDADLIAFIYRDEVYNKNDENNKGVLELIVDKHRNGPIGMIPMHFHKETMGIDDG